MLVSLHGVLFLSVFLLLSNKKRLFLLETANLAHSLLNEFQRMTAHHSRAAAAVKNAIIDSFSAHLCL